jgi:hypothetical protein
MEAASMPPVPQSSIYAVNVISAAAGCNYDSALMVQGSVADGQNHYEVGGSVNMTVGGTTTTNEYALNAKCESGPTGLTNPTIATTINAAGTVTEISTTGAAARTCTATTKNGITTHSQLACKAGTDVSNGGKSLVTASISASSAWTKGESKKQTFNNYDRLTIDLQATEATTVDTAISSTPSQAPAVPNGFNTYYRFTASAGSAFSANLTFTYTDAMLTEYGNYVASELKWAVYDTAKAAWVVKADSRVDVQAKTVAHTTSSFSEWTVMYSPSSAAFSMLPSAALMVTMAVASLFMMSA